MKLKEKLQQLRSEGRGILATNFYNLETLHGVLGAASEMNEPLILQLTQSSIDYMGLETAVNLGRTGLKQFGVEGWIHLDHGGSVDLAQRCLDAGFDSVMIDGSELAFEENIQITREVVERAKKYGAHVEAELGYVAKLGQSHDEEVFTQPEEAKQFVEETGIDALAVAIGTAHGFYQKEPELQLDLLEKIAKATPVGLVLHGGSGVPGSQMQAAISRGICKVNLATEIKNIFMKTLQSELRNNEEIDLRKVFPVATEEITKLVKGKLEIVKNNR
ncbi:MULTISPECIES: class II fructose-bisphosphate aldolase [Salegentibacter]|uniref:Tagatose 1,6-diphosphate aldolase GatY/KbaY n=1 Tax=Salegentibacter agarivorans TaxID=345907 RepID=A0A1I2JXN9_9FLAO|nr:MULTISPECIES: class II fructose-bisphosphate aldolase [Salegentibacter]APS39168.1 ketose-bisphosphate aldolase [Salegentibacter sp. T436]SFF58949.1 tagatose 1,6-diphosphate aldolase GatY/KbaY [Salegentibacter agarivorans]|tara:strand:+ start:504 stop:1328 length:825 start_codon:yes stop_codon:yes gene_type:complete